MGITNLLRELEQIKKPRAIKDYRGLTVAIDAYCWLHKGAYYCAEELVKGRGIEKLLKYCNNRLRMLLEASVTPIIVFDGGKLAAKSKTEEEREKNRKDKLEQAEIFAKTGQFSKAQANYSCAVDITPKMARAWINCLKKEGIEYIVAPYEADAQLAYLYHQGKASVVFTVDSDLLCFGVKRVFFMKDNNGDGYEIDLTNINKIDSFKNFTFDMFFTTCILSGCDYLPSIKGIGFVKAKKYVEEHKTFKKVLKKLKEDVNLDIPHNYKENFIKAMLTFNFQLVFCPDKNELVHLKEVKGHQLEKEFNKFEDTSFLGKFLPVDEARAIARGDIDPISKALFNESDFTNESTNESETGYKKSKLPELMRQKGEFANDRQFWSYYNKIRKAEIEAGIIKPKEKKGKKENEKGSDEEPPKKRGRKRKAQDVDQEEDQFVMTTFIQDLMSPHFADSLDPKDDISTVHSLKMQDEEEEKNEYDDFMYKLNTSPSKTLKEKYGQSRDSSSPLTSNPPTSNSKPKNLAVKSGTKVNSSVNDYFSQFKQKPKTLAELAAAEGSDAKEKVFSSSEIFKSIEKNCKPSSAVSPDLLNKAKRTSPGFGSL